MQYENGIVLLMKNALESWNKVGKSLLNLVYPLKCEVCKKELGPFGEACLCSECRNSIELNPPPFCSKCGKSLSGSTPSEECCHNCKNISYHFRQCWIVGHYDGVLKDCIHSFKFKGRLRLLPIFTELLLGFTKLHIDVSAFDIIVPVPLHKAKARERTFNQAELLAKNFSGRIGIPVYINNLIKAKHTPPQTKLSKKQRASNVSGVFKVVNPAVFKNKHLLLMDDVFTTGHTLNECAKILLEDGARSVTCLALARG